MFKFQIRVFWFSAGTLYRKAFLFSKMTYAEKLKHPKWQKKRLDILSRDEFTCQLCRCKEDTLHVHHKAYKRGREPWDYEDENFITLCEHCHKLSEDWKGLYEILTVKKWTAINEGVDEDWMVVAKNKSTGDNFLFIINYSRKDFRHVYGQNIDSSQIKQLIQLGKKYLKQ